MLNTSFNFYQRFSSHIYIVKLNHTNKFCLPNSSFQSDPAYIIADINSRLFYLLFHNNSF